MYHKIPKNTIVLQKESLSKFTKDTTLDKKVPLCYHFCKRYAWNGGNLYESYRACIPRINKEMERALREYLILYPNAMIHLCRTQSDGSLRHVIIGVFSCVLQLQKIVPPLLYQKAENFDILPPPEAKFSAFFDRHPPPRHFWIYLKKV